MIGEAEVLRLFEGEPVAVGAVVVLVHVLAEGEALVRGVGVDKVDGKVLALAADEATRFSGSLGELSKRGTVRLGDRYENHLASLYFS